MYTIKEAAARTGLTVPVLRAWERRYGVVTPTRTAGGYRVYDEAALGTAAVDAPAGRRRLVAQRGSRGDRCGHGSAGRRARRSPCPKDARAPCVERSSTPRRPWTAARIEAVLDDMFAGGTYERVIDDHVSRPSVPSATAWAAGRVSVAGEHVASNAIQRRLAASFQASGTGREQRRPVLVGMPPGARHELGGLIFATAARRAGLPVVYLGADLPLDDWIAAVERTDARAVVIGAVMAPTRTPPCPSPRGCARSGPTSSSRSAARPLPIRMPRGAVAPDDPPARGCPSGGRRAGRRPHDDRASAPRCSVSRRFSA